MRAVIFGCSEGAVVDRTSNRLSIFNFLEEVQAAGFPVFIQRLTVTTMLEREEDEPQDPATVIRCTLGDQQLFELPYQVAFQGSLRTRTAAEFQGLVIPAPGTVRFELRLGEIVLAFWKLILTLNQPPQVQVVVAPPPA